MSPRRKPHDPWPWPGDSVVDRARRVASSYRHALLAHAPRVCEQLDEQTRRLGQGWVLPAPSYDDDELLTTELAAEYLHVRPKTIDEYRRRGLPVVDTVDGIRYRVHDLKAWVLARRRRRVRQ